MTSPRLIRAGRIVRPHGITGEVKVGGEADVLDALTAARAVFLGADRAQRRVLGCRFHQNAALLRLEGIADRNAAETLRGLDVYISAGDLPRLEDGEYYAHDLIGLRVLDADGQDLGQVADVLATGANDVYVVRSGERELLLPAIESVIREIDLDAGVMRVVVPAGL